MTSSNERLVRAAFRGVLDREPDQAGGSHFLRLLNEGESLEDVINGLVRSEEFAARNAMLPRITLPDLTGDRPKRYCPANEMLTAVLAAKSVFQKATDADFAEFELLIERHRFYDAPGVYSPKIDRDKQLIAEFITKLGGRTCLEIGCFTGPVLSLLKDAGHTVTGVDASHLAFMLAYPNVRPDMIFGDPLAVAIDGGPFDAILAMDIMEHFNPVKLTHYLARVASLLAPDGAFVMNSPIFGADRVWGTVLPIILEEWRSVGDTSFWRDIPCEAGGWPQHGHLVWASSPWWEMLLAQHNLRRDTKAEALYHHIMEPNYPVAPARRMTYVLRHD